MDLLLLKPTIELDNQFGIKRFVVAISERGNSGYGQHRTISQLHVDTACKIQHVHSIGQRCYSENVVRIVHGRGVVQLNDRSDSIEQWIRWCADPMPHLDIEVH